MDRAGGYVIFIRKRLCTSLKIVFVIYLLDGLSE